MVLYVPPLSPALRFADSIRGMLKLILVLMLAGASLSSTWFTLTCLSRVTHLPSTAGGSKVTLGGSLMQPRAKMNSVAGSVAPAQMGLPKAETIHTLNHYVDLQ